MSDKTNKKQLSLDQFGRLVIDGETDLGLISGASLADFESTLDSACHDNAGCGDAECANKTCA